MREQYVVLPFVKEKINVLGTIKEKIIRRREELLKIVIKRSINLGKNQTNKTGTSLINFFYVILFLNFVNVMHTHTHTHTHTYISNA